MKSPLIILSTHFGTNFSGGTLATHETFYHIQDDFSKVIFVGKKVGVHHFDNLEFLPYRNIIDACLKLKRLKKNYPEGIFFGDFYMSYFFVLVNTPFYFAYHDNWPEMGKFGWLNRMRSWFYVPIYRLIINQALWTFTVSKFKLNYVRAISKNSSLVRNGTSLDSPPHDHKEKKDCRRLLMLGNIDDRKYGLAPEVLKSLISESPFLEIDIYGHPLNQSLVKVLSDMPGVHIKGFTKKIEWHLYDAMLTTSKMENLAISVVEALKMGLPVFGYDIGGLNEVVENDANGFLAPLGDKKVLIEKIKEFGLSGKHSYNSDTLVEFDWKIAAQKYQQKILDHA